MFIIFENLGNFGGSLVGLATFWPRFRPEVLATLPRNTTCERALFYLLLPII